MFTIYVTSKSCLQSCSRLVKVAVALNASCCLSLGAGSRELDSFLLSQEKVLGRERGFGAKRESLEGGAI